jgi:hypothetical protein
MYTARQVPVNMYKGYSQGIMVFAYSSVDRFYTKRAVYCGLIHKEWSKQAA